MVASVPASSVASGVVRAAYRVVTDRSAAANLVMIVPISPGRRPSAPSAASMKKVVVVLPFVPVMPIIVIASAGCP